MARTRTERLLLAALLASVPLAAGPSAETEAAARAWRERALAARAPVVQIVEQLGHVSGARLERVTGLLADAGLWLGRGDLHVAEGDAELARRAFAPAAVDYSMAWTCYLNAAMPAIQARIALTGT